MYLVLIILPLLASIITGFFVSRIFTFVSIPFNWKSPFRARSWYTILTFRVCYVLVFVFIRLLLSFIIIDNLICIDRILANFINFYQRLANIYSIYVIFIADSIIGLVILIVERLRGRKINCKIWST